jgi:hypothetical protein
VDSTAAERWIRAHVEPADCIQPVHERPWATVWRVPLSAGVAWFKECAPVQAFEPYLTARLAARWPDRRPEVLGHEARRSRPRDRFGRLRRWRQRDALPAEARPDFDKRFAIILRRAVARTAG